MALTTSKGSRLKYPDIIIFTPIFTRKIHLGKGLTSEAREDLREVQCI